MAIKIQLRRGTAALWTSVNPILADGEQGYETDTGLRKVGNGVDTWNALSYNGSSSKEYFQSSQTSSNTNINNAGEVLDSVQNKNSNNSVFSFSAGVLTINKSGDFKFSVNISGDTNTGARETLRARIQRDTGGGFNDIPNSEAHAEGYSYHRNNASGEDTININTIITVNSGDQFRIFLNSPTNGVNTIPSGTGFLVEEK